jgi:hypothetical protein
MTVPIAFLIGIGFQIEQLSFQQNFLQQEVDVQIPLWRRFPATGIYHPSLPQEGSYSPGLP